MRASDLILAKKSPTIAAMLLGHATLPAKSKRAKPAKKSDSKKRPGGGAVVSARQAAIRRHGSYNAAMRAMAGVELRGDGSPEFISWGGPGAWR
jgi:hypothetical protein